MLVLCSFPPFLLSWFLLGNAPLKDILFLRVAMETVWASLIKQDNKSKNKNRKKEVCVERQVCVREGGREQESSRSRKKPSIVTVV